MISSIVSEFVIFTFSFQIYYRIGKDYLYYYSHIFIIVIIISFSYSNLIIFYSVCGIYIVIVWRYFSLLLHHCLESLLLCLLRRIFIVNKVLGIQGEEVKEQVVLGLVELIWVYVHDHSIAVGGIVIAAAAVIGVLVL